MPERRDDEDEVAENVFAGLIWAAVIAIAGLIGLYKRYEIGEFLRRHRETIVGWLLGCCKIIAIVFGCLVFINLIRLITTNQLDNIPTPTATPIYINHQVQVINSELTMRESPGLNARVVGSAWIGQTLMVVGGPEEADGITWWQVVGWGKGNIRGWCSGKFLKWTIASAPTATERIVLQVGSEVAVVGSELTMRESPGLNTRVVGSAWIGQTLKIVGGPEEADGITWWQVVGWGKGNVRGWCSANLLK